MNNHLVISAIGDDQLDAVEKLSRAVTDNDCNIEDSRMSVLGGTFVLIELVSGKWNNLAKLETALKGIQSELNLSIITRRTEQLQWIIPES